MKRFILFIILGVLASALALQATPQGTQNQKGRGEDVEKRVAQMQQHLNLTADQTTKIRSILQAENDKVRELRSNNKNQSTDRAATAKQMQEIRQDYRKQIESVLTKEQVEKLHQQQKSRRHQSQSSTPNSQNGQ